MIVIDFPSTAVVAEMDPCDAWENSGSLGDATTGGDFTEGVAGEGVAGLTETVAPFKGTVPKESKARII